MPHRSLPPTSSPLQCGALRLRDAFPFYAERPQRKKLSPFPQAYRLAILSLATVRSYRWQAPLSIVFSWCPTNGKKMWLCIYLATNLFAKYGIVGIALLAPIATLFLLLSLLSWSWIACCCDISAKLEILSVELLFVRLRSLIRYFEDIWQGTMGHDCDHDAISW